jgi:hypothetical protein
MSESLKRSISGQLTAKANDQPTRTAQAEEKVRAERAQHSTKEGGRR